MLKQLALGAALIAFTPPTSHIQDASAENQGDGITQAALSPPPSVKPTCTLIDDFDKAKWRVTRTAVLCMKENDACVTVISKRKTFQRTCNFNVAEKDVLQKELAPSEEMAGDVLKYLERDTFGL